MMRQTILLGFLLGFAVLLIEGSTPSSIAGGQKVPDVSDSASSDESEEASTARKPASLEQTVDGETFKIMGEIQKDFDTTLKKGQSSIKKKE